MVENEFAFPGITNPYRALLPRKAMGEILKLAAIRMPILRSVSLGTTITCFFKIGERLLLKAAS